MSLEIIKKVLISKIKIPDWGLSYNLPMTMYLKEAIEEDIKKNDIKEYPVVWDNNGTYILISGRFRLACIKKRGDKEINVKVRKFTDESAAKEYSLFDNIDRRVNNTAVRALIAYELIKECKLPSGYRSDLNQPSSLMKEVDSDNKNHNTYKDVAKKVGVSTGSISYVSDLIEKAPDFLEEALRDEITLTAAYKKMKKSQKDNSPKPSSLQESGDLDEEDNDSEDDIQDPAIICEEYNENFMGIESKIPVFERLVILSKQFLRAYKAEIQIAHSDKTFNLISGYNKFCIELSEKLQFQIVPEMKKLLSELKKGFEK